ncbi:MADB protein [Penicillium frequentans]|uniref:MADB protein n=1 Tax=Penicillium frequentans TaxID=3151616 RepID=A0AAD6GHF5_9EURO|nr:MADB protein [Penicillium glabrum]
MLQSQLQNQVQAEYKCVLAQRYEEEFRQIPNTILEKVAYKWVKVFHPSEKFTKSRPQWWPVWIQYEPPRKMSKASKIILLCHIVRNLVDEESDLEDMRNAMKQIGALEPLEGCRDILNEQPQPSRKRKRLCRMCALCRVTESPEWRKGPEGKRNLCNRCGLRWSKSLRQEGIRVNVIIANQDHLSKTHHPIPNISASSVLPDVTTTHCMQKENSESRVGVCEQTPNGFPERENKNADYESAKSAPRHEAISAVDFAGYSSTSDVQVSLVRQIIPLGSPSSLHWTDFTCDFSIDWQFYSQAGEPLSPITNTLAALQKGRLTSRSDPLPAILLDPSVGQNIKHNGCLGSLRLVVGHQSPLPTRPLCLSYVAFSLRNAITLPDGVPKTTAAHGWHNIPAKIAEIEDHIRLMGM